jgi:hypothetical protein
LREDWRNVQAAAETRRIAADKDGAIDAVKSFHDKLCKTRVLDPACGTGNFLYVSMELMKRLEGEVLEALLDLGGQEALRGLAGHTVDPHQFLGLEINPRAAAITELVLWIGYLQWHFRTKGGIPEQPILRKFRNIEVKNAVLTWDGYPLPHVSNGKETYPNPKPATWPVAEFIVGNPPFTAGQDFRREFGDAHAEALWASRKSISGGADLVMFWWDHAAELLTKPGSVLRRFGLVTTRTITHEFSGRVVARHLSSKAPISLVLAIPNHPWTRATQDAAAVRIAMTVAERGEREGLLQQTETENKLDTDEPIVTFQERIGKINPNLTIGVDITSVTKLLANEGMCHDGIKLHGRGFIITKSEAEHLGFGRKHGLEKIIRPYFNGRDINQRTRGVMVIDLFGFKEKNVRRDYPQVYQHLGLPRPLLN